MEALLSNDIQILTVPGLNGSGPQHWQSVWETKYSNIARIQQQSWEKPSREAWVAAIENQVQQAANKSIILAAHSLGTIAVAHWVQQTQQRIAGALLVAPPWLDSIHLQNLVQSFTPAPTQKLPFKTIVVVSTNDQYASLEQSQFWANTWGSSLINIGNRGHINADSNLNDWSEGIAFLQQLYSLC